MNIFDVIRRETAGRLEKTALIDGGRELSYGELFDSVAAAARDLEKCGIGPAERVALVCNDGIEYVVISLAILSLGGVIVPVSPSHSRDEVKSVLREIDVSFLIFDEDAFCLEHSDPVAPAFVCKKGFLVHRRIARRDPPPGYRALNPAFIRFSSGTTGASKGVVLSHQTIVERTDAANRALAITDDDSVIWVLSMSYHFVVSILLFLRRAAAIVVCCREFPTSLVDGIVRHRGTFMYASPFHYQMMTSSGMFSAEMLSGIRLAVSTAMRLPDAVAGNFHRKFGFELAEAYGVIEVGLPFVNRSRDPRKRGSVGTVLPDYEARIANPDADGIGEVHLRGRGMFDAYYSPWQSRDEALVDGWFTTGDLGRFDPDGFLFLFGREKNVINFMGMKIFPSEVESVLDQHPAVRESLVYATPHDQYGELPCADVVLEGDTCPDETHTSEIRRFCYRHLAPYEVPKRFRYVPSLDKTASGKLKRWGRVPNA